MTSNIKEWLIHALGGYTEEEVTTRHWENKNTCWSNAATAMNTCANVVEDYVAGAANILDEQTSQKNCVILSNAQENELRTQLQHVVEEVNDVKGTFQMQRDDTEEALDNVKEARGD